MDSIRQTKENWDDLAEIDAAWFNVPSDRLADQKWEMGAFFEGGRVYVKRALELLEKHKANIPKNTALDFGCGLGRVTQALADEFSVAYGVDISTRMIESAIQHNQRGDRCRYIANPASDLKIFDDNSINFIFSNNVLQHNPPDIIRNYLREFTRILTPDGVMLFQIPVERLLPDEQEIRLRKLPKIHPKRVWNKLRGILIGHSAEDRYYKLRRLGFSKKWLYEKLGLRPHIDMFFVSEPELREALEGGGCELRHIEKYRYQDMIHAQIMAVKRAISTVGLHAYFILTNLSEWIGRSEMEAYSLLFP